MCSTGTRIIGSGYVDGVTEAEIIAALTRPSARARVGIGDDGAVLDDGTVITVDTMVEGRHWDDKLTPADVGWKLVAVNASDLGAMGARPSWALLSLALPDPVDRAWLDAFRAGLYEALDHFRIELIGGDTVSAPIRVLTLTAGGHADHPVLRSTARPGDDIWVTGQLGLAAEGFLSSHPSPAARAALARPPPPVALGLALAQARLPTAMMDLSDGLRLDLARLCVASAVSADIDADAIPGVPDLAWRVAFGEDYQLLFTAPPAGRSAIGALSHAHGVVSTRIGTITPTAPGGDHTARLLGVDWPDSLFEHFHRG